MKQIDYKTLMENINIYEERYIGFLTNFLKKT